MADEFLDNLIQARKESRDYFTIRSGLYSERECFEAIEALGQKKYVLKHEIDSALKAGVPADSQQMKNLVLAAEQIHRMQAQVVNDVCMRFEVIHPEMMRPDEELLKKKQPYWDWYRDQYYKYYGVKAPEEVSAN